MTTDYGYPVNSRIVWFICLALSIFGSCSYASGDVIVEDAGNLGPSLFGDINSMAIPVTGSTINPIAKLLVVATGVSSNAAISNRVEREVNRLAKLIDSSLETSGHNGYLLQLPLKRGDGGVKAETKKHMLLLDHGSGLDPVDSLAKSRSQISTREKSTLHGANKDQYVWIARVGSKRLRAGSISGSFARQLEKDAEVEARRLVRMRRYLQAEENDALVLERAKYWREVDKRNTELHITNKKKQERELLTQQFMRSEEAVNSHIREYHRLRTQYISDAKTYLSRKLISNITSVLNDVAGLALNHGAGNANPPTRPPNSSELRDEILAEFDNLLETDKELSKTYNPAFQKGITTPFFVPSIPEFPNYDSLLSETPVELVLP